MKVQKAAKNRIAVCAIGFAVILTAAFLIVRFCAPGKEPVEVKTDQDARMCTRSRYWRISKVLSGK